MFIGTVGGLIARKSSAVKRVDVENSKFDDSKYGHVLYSVTYDVNEYSIDQAAGFLGGQKSKNIVLGASAISLLLLILILINDSKALVPAFVMVGVSIAASAAATRHSSSNWRS